MVDRKAYFAAYRAKNRERINALNRAYWAGNKDRLNALRRDRQGEHYARYKDYYKGYYQANRERILARKKAARATPEGRAKHNARTMLSKYRALVEPTPVQMRRMVELAAFVRGK